MRTTELFRLETPYREPLVVEGFLFGDADGTHSAVIVGSLRGDEVQQTFVCAELVRRLQSMEARGLIGQGHQILVIPHVNGFSMNIEKRFWPHDNTDINRMFPGYDKGETTQRIAAGLFNAISDYRLGIQLCSFYQPGNFFPHVSVINVCDISTETLELAAGFGLPYVVEKKPSPYDSGTLNYNWQVWGCHAFSVYCEDRGGIDRRDATLVEDGILRFLASQGIVGFHAVGGSLAARVLDSDLIEVRTEHAGGFFDLKVRVGDRVEQGTVLAEVLDTKDCHIKDTLVCPVDGYVFFTHTGPLVNQYTIAFRIVPE